MDSSCDDLKRKFLDTLDAPAGETPWLQCWRLLIEHPWYQVQLDICAKRALRVRAQSDLLDDVKQDAMLLMARNLQRASDLRVDRSRVNEHFPGWMATIILHDCRQAVRALRRHQRPSVQLHDYDVAIEPSWTMDALIDLSLGTFQLNDRQRTVVELQLKGKPIREIAADLGLSYWQVYRAAQEGMHCLRRPP